VKKIYTILILCLSGYGLYAQNYTRAIGIRGGMTSGITYRIHTSESMVNEMILKIKSKQMNFTFLRLSMEPNAFGYSPRLILTKGFGGHIGYGYNDRFSTIRGDIVYSKNRYYPVLGFDAFLGLEYQIPEFPVVLGIDYKPFFEFSTLQIYKLYIWDIAFAIKYRF